MQRFIEIKVDYIYDSRDDTLIGSRNGLISLLGKWYIQNFGDNGQKEFVDYCLKGKLKFVEAIKKELEDNIELHHSCKYMNFICFSFKNMIENQILECEELLMLRYYLIDGKKFYKIPIMPHTVKSIKKFVEAVKKALNA